MAYKLGVDVGGTFTDLVLMPEDGLAVRSAKVPSTPDDPAQAILNGVAYICEKYGVSTFDIDAVMHGTTVATNAILTRAGAQVGLIVTKGFKHTLHVGRGYCPGIVGGWVTYEKRPSLIPLDLVFEIEERILSDGSVRDSLDEKQVKQTLKELHTRGCEAITVCLMNSYVNPGHEQMIGTWAKEVLGDFPVSLSSEVLPEAKEYERCETTAVNAYVRPEVERYMQRLSTELAAQVGASKPLYILRSDGGLTSPTAAAMNPVSLLMSGPAGGVHGALYFCGLSGFHNLLTFDMGGTSTDVALVYQGKPGVRRETEVGDVSVGSSSLDIKTVGAGGGSIAHVPELTGALRVGPASAGAVPGPAAYLKGGELATVCDANVVLGYIPNSAKLGGDMPISRDAAEAAVSKIASSLGLSVLEAAEGIIRIANEAIMGALRLVSVEKGYDPNAFALVAFGGAGPLHANAMGMLMNTWPVIVPRGPGVLCAYGDVTTGIREEVIEPIMRTIDEFSEANLRKQFQDLEEKCRDAVAKVADNKQRYSYSHCMDIKYAGQSEAISLELDNAAFDAEGMAWIRKKFAAEHERNFGFAMDIDEEVESIRVIATQNLPHGAVDSTSAYLNASVSQAAAESDKQVARFYYDGSWHDAALYDRLSLPLNSVVSGPALLAEMDSNTIILPGHHAQIDTIGNLLIYPNESEA